MEPFAARRSRRRQVRGTVLEVDDYYSLLGVAADADDVQLRRVWRRLALRWHPDRAGPAATATFQKISAAYAVLSDPVARAKYDATLGGGSRFVRNAPAPDRSRRRGEPAADGRSPAGKEAVARRRRAPGVMLSRLSGQLNALLASGAARRVAREEIELYLRPHEAVQGGMVSISMRVPIRCPECAEGGACARCEGQRTFDELFSAWLAVPPGVSDGTLLEPTEMLRGMQHPVRFRLRIREPHRG